MLGATRFGVNCARSAFDRCEPSSRVGIAGSGNKTDRLQLFAIFLIGTHTTRKKKDTANPSSHHLIASPYNLSSIQALAPVGIM